MKLFLLLCLLPALALGAPILQAVERDLNSFVSKIASMMPFSGAIADVSGLLTKAETLLALVTFTKTSADDLSGACKPVTVIFARGTTEPGNVGVLVGPPFFAALRSAVGSGNVAVQGVSYPADVPGFLSGGSDAGGQTMASLVQQARTKCPSTKIVMSGYSQGGQVVHKAAKLLPAEVQAAVSSVVIFGDPVYGTSVTGLTSAKCLVVCHVADNICEQGDIVLPAHLTYAMQATQAAAFVKSAAGL